MEVKIKQGVNFADKNPIDRTDWQQVRIQAAIAAMQGMLSNPSSVCMKDEVIIQESAKFADALIEELKGE